MTVETSPAVILGETISVGLRTYLEITAISVHPEAEEGDWVYVGVQVTNKHTADIYATVIGTFDGISTYPLGGAPSVIKAGEYKWWPLHFTMPNKSVTGTVRAYYWGVDEEWHLDDTADINIALKVPLAGTIVRMELEYDGVTGPIPVRDIPQGKGALIDIWGRNDTSVTQRLGLSWAIRDPDGLIIEEGSDWEMWPGTGPGGQHHFVLPPSIIPGYFIPLSLDKVGTYTIGLALVMNPDNPTIVDDYAGDLCTVVAPVFKGTITRVALEWNGNMVDAPVVDIPLDSRVLVHIWGRNDTADNQKLGLYWQIKDPDYMVVEVGTDWEMWHTGPGGQHHFVLPPGVLEYLNLNKVGQYMLSAQLLMNPDSPVTVDTYTGVICTVVALPPPEFKGTIIRKELEYDGKQAPIPVANVLVALEGLVHIWGRNDMATNQKLGISWVIKDPDGLVVEQGTDWEGVEILPEWLPGGYTGPGGQHHFIIPTGLPGYRDRIDFDKLGTYTMSIELLMKDSPVPVDSYNGNLCTVTMEIPPEYELIQETIYPHAYIYDGWAEVGVATFSLPVGPPPIVDWLGAKIVNSFADEVEKEGSRMLELKVYRYTSVPWVNYRLEATAAVTPQEGIGIAIWPVLAALPWKAIITAAIIAAIMIIVTRLVILPVLRILFERKPGLSEEVKKQWSREYIIGIIIDMRPAYSPEELGAMSDQELRDLLDVIYKQEVPPAGLKWWQWCIIGGVGIAGGALAYRFISPLLPKRKEEGE